MASDWGDVGSKANGAQSQRFVFAKPAREPNGLEVAVALVEAEVAAARAAMARSKYSVPKSRQDWGWRSIRWKTASFKDGRGRKRQRVVPNVFSSNTTAH